MKLRRALIVKWEDNVATVLEEVESGDKVAAKISQETRIVDAKEGIPFGFKIALTSFSKGEAIIKYGEVIGRAITHIEEGSLVHIHNLEGTRGRGDLNEN